MTVKDYVSLLLPNEIIIINHIGKADKDIVLQAYQLPADIMDTPIQTLTHDSITTTKAEAIIKNTSAHIPNLLINDSSEYVCPVIIL